MKNKKEIKNEVTVLNKIYTIEYQEFSHFPQEYDGLCDDLNQILHVTGNNKKPNVIIHELIHAYLTNSGYLYNGDFHTEEHVTLIEYLICNMITDGNLILPKKLIRGK